MEIRFRKVSENAIDPVLNADGTISVYAADAIQALDATRRPVLVYKTGLTVDIPEGYNFITMPAKMNVVRSLIFGHDMILSNEIISGLENGELLIEYKIDTNVLPATYQAGEEVARLYLVKQEYFNMAVDAYVAPVEETVTKEEAMENETRAEVCEACQAINAPEVVEVEQVKEA